MNRQTILVVALIICTINIGKSCDACGCSVSTGGLGLLPQMHYNFAGIRWQRTVFRSVEGYDKGNETIDQFDQFEVWGRYYLSDRFQMAAVIPYKMNTRSGNNTLPFELSGIGDISVFGFYSGIKTFPADNKPGHQLDLGFGVKTPTGKYNPIQDDKLPDNMNLGTASLDFIVQTTYTLKFERSGLTANATYRINTENRYNYKFGNRFTGNVYAYWQMDIKKTKLVPFGGIYLEHIAKDDLYGDHPHGTGGSGVFGTLGFDFYIGKFTVGSTFQSAFDQTYADDEMIMKPRFSINAAYLF